MVWAQQRWAFGYCRGLQDMASLFEKLQPWGSRPYRPQYPPLFHAYKEPELQTSLLAQELSQYHFQIDYCLGKANVTADVLSRFSQRSQDEEKELRAENGQIFHRLQNSLTSASLASLSFRPLHLYQFSFVEYMYYSSWGSSGAHSKANCWMKVFIMPSSVAWDWGYTNYRPKTSKPGNWRPTNSPASKAGRISLACYTTRASSTSRKLSKRSSSAGTTTSY